MLNIWSYLRRLSFSGHVISVALAISACTVSTVDADSFVTPGESLTGNYLAGRHAQLEGDMAAAAIYLGAALGEDPDEFDLIRRTFLVYLSDGRIDEATKLAKDIHARVPQNTFSAYTLASSYLAAGDMQSARDILFDLHIEGLNTFLVPLLSAWTFIGEDDPDQALELLLPLAGGQGTVMLHDAHAALINAASKRYDEAERLFGSLVESQGNMTIRTTELFGALYEQTGAFDKAIALYNGHISENGPTRFMEEALQRAHRKEATDALAMNARAGAAESMFDMASSLRQQNSYESALLLGRLGLFLRPDFPSLQLMVGSVLERLGRYGDANDVYHAINPDVPYAWNANLRIATNLNDMGDTDQAISTLQKLAEDAPEKADPLIELGDVLRGSERFDEAVEAYSSALDRIGDVVDRHWSLLYARGIALERSGRWEQAEADFLKALEFRPDQPYVLNYLGYTWVEKGLNLDRAQEMIRTAVELRPNDGYIVDSLGWVYYQLGDFEKAVKELERAVELLPEDPVINDHLGDAYWKVGRTREARFQWRRSLSLQPDTDEIPVIEAKIKAGLAETSTEDTSG